MTRVLKAGKLLALALLGGCQGAWADYTHVTLAPLHGSRVHAGGEVSIGRKCDTRCVPSGSSVMIAPESGMQNHDYRFIVAKGSCSSPRSFVAQIAQDSWNNLRAYTATAFIDVPVETLTSGDYVLVIRDLTMRADVACGRIKRSGFV